MINYIGLAMKAEIENMACVLSNVAATQFQAICLDKFAILNLTRSEAKASLDGNEWKERLVLLKY